MEILNITYSEAKAFLQKYHYLNKSGSGFRSGLNYGLFEDDQLIGVCIYHAVSSQHTIKGMLDDRSKIIYEMGRLCLHPEKGKKNRLSQFVAATFKDIKKNHSHIDYILTYADDGLHSGKIYQALSMLYYGLSLLRNDFWLKLEDGTFKKQWRGTTKGKEGEWRPRTQKHRYVKCMKKKTEKHILWTKQDPRKIEMKNQCWNHFYRGQPGHEWLHSKSKTITNP